jgi:hypothetical protein
VTITYDPENIISELNESNNSKTVYMSIDGAPCNALIYQQSFQPTAVKKQTLEPARQIKQAKPVVKKK